MVNFDPQPTLIVTKFETRDYVADIYHQTKYWLSNRSGFFFSPYTRSNKLYTLKPSNVYFTFFLVFPLAYRRDRWTDLTLNTSYDAVLRNEVPFGG